MAEWNELSENQKHHANAFMDLHNTLTDVEQQTLNRIKHDYEKAKNYLENHPKLKKAANGTVATMTGLTGLYVAKRIGISLRK